MTVKAEKKTISESVELKSGERVKATAWPWEDVEAHLMTFAELINEVRQMGGLDLKNESALPNFIFKQFTRVKGLIAASLENGEDDLKKTRGLNDIIKVIRAVLVANEVQEALGNVMDMMTEMTQAMNRGMTPEMQKRAQTLMQAQTPKS